MRPKKIRSTVTHAQIIVTLPSVLSAVCIAVCISLLRIDILGQGSLFGK